MVSGLSLALTVESEQYRAFFCELCGGALLASRGMTEPVRGVRMFPLTEMGYTGPHFYANT